MGDFDDFKQIDTSLSSNLYFLILLGVSLAVVIIMLNLLIAIISDSFEKVMALDKQASLYEKLQLIVEIDRKRKNKSLTESNSSSLYVFKFNSLDEENDETEERIRNKLVQFKKSLDYLRNDIHDIKSLNRKIVLKTDLETNLQELESSLKFEYAKIIKQEFATSNSRLENLLSKIEMKDLSKSSNNDQEKIGAEGIVPKLPLLESNIFDKSKNEK